MFIGAKMNLCDPGRLKITSIVIGGRRREINNCQKFFHKFSIFLDLSIMISVALMFSQKIILIIGFPVPLSCSAQIF
jgi:hypothetical protein